jgi:hypothetical protein
VLLHRVACWSLTLAFLAGSAFAQQRLVEPSAADSAHPTALAVLRHLAGGDIEAAAALSNAPRRRLELLRGYRDAIGEEQFRQVFARYSQGKLIAEVALGPRRLLVWDLGEADERIAGQFYVEVDGKFLMDDVPSRERAELRTVLQRYRREMQGQALN